MTTDLPAVNAAIGTLPRGALLLIRMAGPVHAVDYIVHAAEAHRLGATAHARIATGRAMDAFARRPPSRHAAVWAAALSELATATGAARLPSVVEMPA